MCPPNHSSRNLLLPQVSFQLAFMFSPIPNCYISNKKGIFHHLKSFTGVASPLTPSQTVSSQTRVRQGMDCIAKRVKLHPTKLKQLHIMDFWGWCGDERQVLLPLKDQEYVLSYEAEQIPIPCKGLAFTTGACLTFFYGVMSEEGMVWKVDTSELMGCLHLAGLYLCGPWRSAFHQSLPLKWFPLIQLIWRPLTSHHLTGPFKEMLREQGKWG